MKRTFFSFLFITVLAFPIGAQTNSELYEKCRRENQGYKEQIKNYKPVLDKLSDALSDAFKKNTSLMQKIINQKTQLYNEITELNKLFNKNVKRCVDRKKSLLKEEERRIADYNAKVDYFTKKVKELNQIGNRNALSQKLLDHNLDILTSINKTAFSDFMNEFAKFDAEWSSKKHNQSIMSSDMKFLQANSYDASIGDFDNREFDSNESESSRDNSNNLESELNDLQNTANNIGDISELTSKKRTSSANNSSMFTNNKGETVGGSTLARNRNTQSNNNLKGTEQYRRAMSTPYMSNSSNCCALKKKEGDRYTLLHFDSYTDKLIDVNGKGYCNRHPEFRNVTNQGNDLSCCDCLLDEIEYWKNFYCCVKYIQPDLDINYIRTEAAKRIKTVITWFDTNCN